MQSWLQHADDRDNRTGYGIAPQGGGQEDRHVLQSGAERGDSLRPRTRQVTCDDQTALFQALSSPPGEGEFQSSGRRMGRGGDDRETKFIDELIGFPHEVLFGFVRISTNPNLGEAAVSLSAAAEVVEGWIGLANSRILLPGPDHFSNVMRLMTESHSVGRVLSDAVLADHAITNRATLCSTDSDFARFDGLDWRNPLS